MDQDAPPTQDLPATPAPLIIFDVTASTLRLPLERPVRTSNLIIEHREFVFVEVRGRPAGRPGGSVAGLPGGPERRRPDGDLAGHGFGFTRGGLVAETINHTLRPLLVGKDAGAIHARWQELYAATRYLGRKGLLMRAISAVDIALWDLKGKALGAPLWSLLGGSGEPVPAYVAGGYYGQGTEPSAVREEFSRYQGAGYRGAKLNIGGLELEADLARVTAAREAFGPGTDLMVDLNGSLPNAKAGLRLADALKPFDVAFIEEPFLMDDLPAHRAFYPRCDLPVALGEDESGRWAFAELLEPRVLDVLRHDATLVGGVSEWLKVAGLGLAKRVDLFPHWFPEVHVHLASTYPECMGVELIAPETGIMNFHELLRNPLTQTDGFARPPDAPGLGIEWNWDAIERAAVA